MQLKIKSPEDFWSGLMFVAFGIAAILYMSRNYPMGSIGALDEFRLLVWTSGNVASQQIRIHKSVAVNHKDCVSFAPSVQRKIPHIFDNKEGEPCS